MNIKRFFNLLIIVLSIALITSCSDDDSDSNPTDPNGGNNDSPPTVNVEQVTVPQKMQTAANNGDAGAAQAMAYIQIANTLPAYSQMLNPPATASKVSSTSSVEGDWTWTQDGATFKLSTTETATEYHWILTIDGTFSGKTYSNQVVVRASELKDGSSGELEFYDPDSGSPVVSFSWENQADGTYYVNLSTTQSSNNVTVEMYFNPDNSGSIDIYVSGGGTWEIDWASDGSGTWVEYDSSGSVSDSGSWG